MFQLLGVNLVTLAMVLVITTIRIIYGFFRRKEFKGKPLPQAHGIKPYFEFFSYALDNNLHGWSLHWAKEFGDIFNMKLPGFNLVFINTAAMVRRILNAPEYRNYSNDRPYTFIGRYGFYNDKSVAFYGSAPMQRQRRKAFHNSLKFYGDGVGNVESVILRILEDEVDVFKTQRVVNISDDISRIVLRIVDHLFVGYKPENSEYRVQRLYEFNLAFDKLFIYGNEAILQPFPFLRFVPGKFKRLYDEFIRTRNNLEKTFFADKESLKVDEDGGLVGQLLKLQENNGLDIFPDETIKAILLEATVASYLTTSSLINTVVILFIKYPELQKELYEELERVVGDEQPSLRRHKHQMPKMDSFILEILRFGSSAPFLLLHSLTEDIEFEGYHIPKDSILITNAWYAQRHPDHWEDPWTFKPDRFLDADGCLVPANDPLRLNLFPFGTGGRACPGEAFAKSRIFLIISTLMKNFHFFKAPECDVPNLDPRTWRPGAVVGPDKFKCSICPRKRMDFWAMNDQIIKEE